MNATSLSDGSVVVLPRHKILSTPKHKDNIANFLEYDRKKWLEAMYWAEISLPPTTINDLKSRMQIPYFFHTTLAELFARVIEERRAQRLVS